ASFKLASFPPIQSVNQTPSTVLYFSDGVEYLGWECKAMRTLLHIKPILEILVDDTEGVLHITLEKCDTGGTNIFFENSDGVALGEDVYEKETFLLDSIKLMYMFGTLFLPNEYSYQWFFKKVLDR
ncbi:MAG: hypothetical protein AAFX53_19245, partial [Bacteroidota bacterium]